MLRQSRVSRTWTFYLLKSAGLDLQWAADRPWSAIWRGEVMLDCVGHLASQGRCAVLLASHLHGGGGGKDVSPPPPRHLLCIHYYLHCMLCLHTTFHSPLLRRKYPHYITRPRKLCKLILKTIKLCNRPLYITRVFGLINSNVIFSVCVM